MSKKTASSRPSRSSGGGRAAGHNGAAGRARPERLENLFADLEAEPTNPFAEASGAQPAPAQDAAPEASATHPASTPDTGPALPRVEKTTLPPPDGGTLVGLQDLGFRADEIQVIPARSILTPAGRESLQQRSLVAKPAQSREPASLALTLPVAGDESSLLLEFLDTDPSRRWSEDELRLVEQVSDQLSLALQNASLFEQTQARAEELAILHEVALELAQEQLDLEAVYEILLRRAIDLLDSDHGEIWLWRAESGALERVGAYPAVQPVEPGRPLSRLAPGEGLAGRAFSEQRTLAVNRASPLPLPGAERAGSPVLAAMVVPMRWQNQVIGILQLSRTRSAEMYTTNHQRLAELLAGQGSAVIQNSRLFAQTQQALEALKVRERYQTNVARAVSALTAEGTRALPEVLQWLGEAGGAERAYYFEPSSASHGAGQARPAAAWRLSGEWRADHAAAVFDSLSDRLFDPATLGDWAHRLASAGVLWTNASLAGEAERRVCETFHAASLIQFSIPGKDGASGCLGFGHPDPHKAWAQDEIAALQTAAAALATTIAREDLFHQVQANLAETEALYQASAELSAASSYEEILTVLRRYTVLGHPDAASVVIGLFDHPWEPGSPAGQFLPVSRWNAAEPAHPTAQPASRPRSRYALSAWPAVSQVLNAETPAFVPRTAADPRFQELDGPAFEGLVDGQSLVFAPLAAGGRWIGELSATYRREIACSEAELRRLASLAGQAAVAVQNLHQLHEIQARAQQEALTREIGAQISSSIDLATVLKTTARSIGQALGASQVVVRMKPGPDGRPQQTDR